MLRATRIAGAQVMSKFVCGRKVTLGTPGFALAGSQPDSCNGAISYSKKQNAIATTCTATRGLDSNPRICARGGEAHRTEAAVRHQGRSKCIQKNYGSSSGEPEDGGQLREFRRGAPSRRELNHKKEQNPRSIPGTGQRRA